MCVSFCTCLIPAANAHQWYVCFAKGDTVRLSGDDTTYVGKTSYKRLSRIIDYGMSFGLTSASYREEVTLLGSLRGQDGYRFRVTESRLRSTP